MVNNQVYFLEVINEYNRKRICLKCLKINKITSLYCQHCLCKLRKFPNQLPYNYIIGFSQSNNGAIYFYNIDKYESYWYPL